jgi:hypothetical protein
MIPDLAIVIGGPAAVGLSALAYEFGRRGGTLRRRGPWTDQRPACGWRTPADWPAGRTPSQAEFDAAFDRIAKREKRGLR